MLSVVICTYNRDKFLYDALRHVAVNDFPIGEYEIVLVNNNSTDTTESECQRFAADFPQVQFRYFVESRGYPTPATAALTKAAGMFWFFWTTTRL